MRLALLLFGLTLLPATALAASKQDSKKAAALVQEANRDYAAGRYAEAAAALEKAHALAPHPRILYNLARAYDQAGELEKSLETYQRYIASPEGTDPTLLKRSSLAVDRLRGLVSTQQQERARAEAERQRLDAERLAAEDRARQEAEAKRQIEEAAKQRQRERLLASQQGHDRLQLAAWVTAGVGVAALGTGAVFGYQAWQTGRSDSGAVATAETYAQKQDAVAVAKNQALIADIALGAGVVAAVASVLLWPKEPRPALTMVAGPGGAFVEVKF